MVTALERAWESGDPKVYTIEQQKAACIAHLASGNSVEDLCMMIIRSQKKMAKADDDQCIIDFFDDIAMEFQVARQESPESFETSADEEIDALVEIYNEHSYEANSQAWG